MIIFRIVKVRFVLFTKAIITLSVVAPDRRGGSYSPLVREC